MKTMIKTELNENGAKQKRNSSLILKHQKRNNLKMQKSEALKASFSEREKQIRFVK